MSGSTFSTSASYSAPAPNLSHCVTYPIVLEIVDVNPVASITTFELNVIFPSGPVPFTPMMFWLSSLITSLMLVFTKISAPNFLASSDNHRYVFLTSNTAAVGIESLMVTSLFGDANEKFLIG